MNHNESLALLFSLLAGLSTCIGSMVIFFTRYYNTKILDFSFGFSAGVMIYIAIGDLMVESQELIRQSVTGKKGDLLSIVFLIIGLLLAALIEGFVPKEPELKITRGKGSAQVFRVGIVSAIAMVLHNFPEGIATFMAGIHGISMGLPIMLAVAMHNIPEGLCIAMPIYFATKSRKKAFVFSFLSGLAEPAGAIITYLFLRPFINSFLLGIIFAIVAGTMLFISFCEILPASWQHGHKYVSLCGVLLGLTVMALCLIII